MKECVNDLYALDQDLDLSLNTSWKIWTLCWQCRSTTNEGCFLNHLEVPSPFAGSYFHPKHALNKNWDSTRGQICVLQCFADFQSSKISSHQSLHDLPTGGLPWFSKGQCIECLVPAGNLQGFQLSSLVSRCFGGKCPSPSLGRQMFDLNKIHSMVSWWDASFWIHPDFICCSIASGGHSNHFLIFFCSLFWSSQCTMELRCIDWYMNLPTRATWLQERHCCKQYYIHEFIHKSSVSYDLVSLKPVTITSCLCKCFLFICDTLKSTCFCSDFKQIIYQDFRVIPARPGPSSIATRCQGSTSKVEVEIITETNHQSLEYHNKNRQCVQQ